jgi:hypothetical protein
VNLLFSKLVPGGNPTLVLHDPDLSGGSLAEVAARLMSPLHVHAEQVGALYSAVAGQYGGLPRLVMMGGEFCVNAARCAAMLLALQREGRFAAPPAPDGLPGHTDVTPDTKLQSTGLQLGISATEGRGEMRSISEARRDHARAAAELAKQQEAVLQATWYEADLWSGELLVSGRAEPVRLLACAEAGALARALAPESGDGSGGRCRFASERKEERPAGTALFCAARVADPAGDTAHQVCGDGLGLVRMPGISHLLVEEARHPVPSMSGTAWKEQSGALRRKTGIAGSPASGVVWFRREEQAFRIWPAVEVLATSSEYLESACGSASLALALWLWRRNETPAAPVDVLQPSGGTLRVYPDREEPGAAWISGPVSLVARGTAYV